MTLHMIFPYKKLRENRKLVSKMCLKLCLDFPQGVKRVVRAEIQPTTVSLHVSCGEKMGKGNYTCMRIEMLKILQSVQLPQIIVIPISVGPWIKELSPSSEENGQPLNRKWRSTPLDNGMESFQSRRMVRKWSAMTTSSSESLNTRTWLWMDLMLKLSLVAGVQNGRRPQDKSLSSKTLSSLANR